MTCDVRRPGRIEGLLEKPRASAAHFETAAAFDPLDRRIGAPPIEVLGAASDPQVRGEPRPAAPSDGRRHGGQQEGLCAA